MRAKQILSAYGPACLVMVLFSSTAASQALKERGPLEPYLMADRAEEIRLARSAAPASLSDQASVYVLESGGYELAVEGTNGFVCLVDRSFTGPFSNPEFWNPRHRDPICYNPAAARSALAMDLLRTRLALQGLSKGEIEVAMKRAFESGELSPPEHGSIAYMMSKQQFLGEAIGAWHPHLMLYVANGVYSELGAGIECSPVVPFFGDGETMAVVLIVVPSWSDGSIAPAYSCR